MPGLEITDTGRRTAILIHPGKDEFRSTVGCINLCTHLDTPAEIISYKGSRRRVIALIEDIKAFLGGLPGPDQPIPNAFVVIGEAALTAAEAPAKPVAAAPPGPAPQPAPAAQPPGIGWPLKHNLIRRNSNNHTFGMVRNGGKRPHQGWDFEALPERHALPLPRARSRSSTNLRIMATSSSWAFRSRHDPLRGLCAPQRGRSCARADGRQGEKLGLTGNTGNAKGMIGRDQHLHFEIRTEPRPGRGLDGRMSPIKIFGAIPLSAPIDV